ERGASYPFQNPATSWTTAARFRYRLLGSFGRTRAAPAAVARYSSATPASIRPAATARFSPRSIKAKSFVQGGFAEAEPERTTAASASTAATAAARGLMKR